MWVIVFFVVGAAAAVAASVLLGQTHTQARQLRPEAFEGEIAQLEVSIKRLHFSRIHSIENGFDCVARSETKRIKKLKKELALISADHDPGA